MRKRNNNPFAPVVDFKPVNIFEDPKPEKKSKCKLTSYQKDKIKNIAKDCEMKIRRCPKKAQEVHHIKYCSAGGTDAYSNLIALCGSCHNEAHPDRATGEVKISKEKLYGIVERRAKDKAKLIKDVLVGAKKTQRQKSSNKPKNPYSWG
jgi:hypothetical protein